MIFKQNKSRRGRKNSLRYHQVQPKNCLRYRESTVCFKTKKRTHDFAFQDLETSKLPLIPLKNVKPKENIMMLKNWQITQQTKVNRLDLLSLSIV